MGPSIEAPLTLLQEPVEMLGFDRTYVAATPRQINELDGLQPWPPRSVPYPRD